jgi:type II restriction enzyme
MNKIETLGLVKMRYMTNFIYEIIGANIENSNIFEYINRVYSSGGCLKFVNVDDEEFDYDLLKLDYYMSSIISSMLLYYYKSGDSYCCNALKYIEQNNPLGYPRLWIYEYKFKEFLLYYAHSKGVDMSQYNPYKQNEFKDYLLENAYFNVGSSSRQQYAIIYQEDDKMYINLNLQIRFYGNH